MGEGKEAEMDSLCSETPQEKQEEDMTVEDMCKAAITGDIKPSVGSTIRPCVGSDNFKKDCIALRSQIEETKLQAMLVFREHPVFSESESSPPRNALNEMKINFMLAYRHLEDAKMRLGKAIQAFEGGKSIYLH